MPEQTPQAALITWAQFRQLGMSPERIAEITPLVLERWAAIDELRAVDVDGVDPAVSFSVERPTHVP